MLDSRNRPQRYSSICLLVLLFAIVGAAGFGGVAVADTGVDASVQDGSLSGDTADTGAAISVTRGMTDTPAPSAENQTREVLVRFSPHRSTAEEVTHAHLRAHAAETQQPFVGQYADHPAIEIQSQFWAANAILLSVDTDQIVLDTLNESAHVVGVHENTPVTITDVSPATLSDTERPPTGADVRSQQVAQWQQTTTNRPASQPTQTASISPSATTYGIELIQAPAVWQQFNVRGEGVGVAVIDTGVDPDREDLQLAGWAEFDQDGHQVASTPRDGVGHGTHVAGTVAGNNASGTAIGVAPAADVYGVKTFDENGTATLSAILAGIEWAIANDAVDIIQMSFGTEGMAEPLVEPIINARKAGKLPVASAGNEGVETSNSPGNVYDAVSVGAVDADRSVASFSSGDRIQTDSDWDWNMAQTSRPDHWPDTYVVPSVTAPGVGVQSARAGDATGLTIKSGTSMASPHVSGVAALVWAATDQKPSVNDVTTVIQATADHPNNSDPDIRYGSGVVDALSAVETATDEQSNSELVVSSFETPDRVTRGESLTVHTTVTNTGGVRVERTVEYVFDGTVVDTRDVAVSPGDSTTLSFMRGTDDLAPGEYTHSIRTGDETHTRSIRVDAPGKIVVSGFDSPSSVSQGDPIVSNVTLENIGETTVTREVIYRFNGSEVETASVQLGGGDSTTRTVTYQSTAVEPGTYDHAVITGDDEQRRSVEITAVPEAEITFSDQRSGGTQIVVSSAAGPDPFVLVLTDMHTNRVGVSGELTKEADSLPISLTERLTHNSAQQLTATVHSVDETASGGVGRPITRDGQPVADTATVDVDGRLLYTNADGRIDATGLRAAFADWKQGEINGQLLRETFAGWKHGTVVQTETEDATSRTGMQLR